MVPLLRVEPGRVPIQDQAWHKENLLNVGIRAIREADPGCRYICWADADIEFIAGRSAVREIVAALESHPVVQAFSSALDLGPRGEVLKVDQSFAFSAAHGFPKRHRLDQTTWHSGYVWAARVDFLDAIGGLFDLAILGAGDHLMARAFSGDPDLTTGADARGDIAALLPWAKRAAKALEGTEGLGYAPCVIRHGFHGFKKDRGYTTRGAILERHRFDPSSDLVENADGLHEFVEGVPRVAALVADILSYFRGRKEDR